MIQSSENLGYLIYVAHTVLSKYTNQSIHRILPGITGVQFTILIYLYYHQHQTTTQRDVINYLHLQHPTVRHIIKLMLKKKLLESAPLSTDHRQIQIKLSRTGIKLIKVHLPALNHDFHQLNLLITKGLSGDDQKVFARSLQQLVKNLEK